jgi:plastocyanin
VRIRFKNSAKGDDDHSAQFLRIEGDHTVAEGIKAAEAWGDKGRPLPPWLRIAGGTGGTQPGRTSSAEQVLTAGRYAAIDIGSNEFAEFDVTEDGGGELPTAVGRIEASEYKFDAQGLRAGRNRVEFVNVGKQPHHMLAAPFKPGKTLADLREFVTEEEGEPPIVEEESVQSAIFDGGGRQALELDLKKGKYGMVCFVSDRAGGPPHTEKGMISEVVVR